MSQSPPASRSDSYYDVAIIGAGFSGSMLAVHLARAEKRPHVALIERSRAFGTGLAYGGISPEHSLNVPAGNMSAFDHDPGHLLRWLQEHPKTASAFGIREIRADAFLPRPLFGRYLSDLLQEAAKNNDHLHLTEAQAVDVQPMKEGGYKVQFADGGSLRAHHVVLAWGHFPPTVPIKGVEADALINPWKAQAREVLSQNGEVLILGAGLTGLDLLATAHKLGRTDRLHVLSRHGRFPQFHGPSTHREASAEGEPWPKSIRQIFARVRQNIAVAEAEGDNWRSVIDSLRPITQALWSSLPDTERRRFLRHVRALWENVRHRAAPHLQTVVNDFEQRGILQRHCGHILSLEANGTGFDVSYRPRGFSEIVTLKVQAVINATGPSSNLKRIKSPLLQNLLTRGLIQPDALGLGVALGSSNQAGSLHLLGTLRRGELWESTAVPELRVQAAELAQQLLSSHTPAASKSATLFHPGHLWLFQI